jgi:hypothetical protein
MSSINNVNFLDVLQKKKNERKHKGGEMKTVIWADNKE